MFAGSSDSSQRVLPQELIQCIAQQLPRSSLTEVALVNTQWYKVTMPLLFRHIYICTPHHWNCFLRTLTTSLPACWASHVHSIVLEKSPPLEPARLAGPRVSATSHRSLGNGYIRLERVNFDQTGLESVEDNGAEIDTTSKESEWLQSVSDVAMAAIIQRCPQLQFLNVAGCEKLGDRTIQALVSSSRVSIHGLCFGLMRSLSPQSLIALVESEQCKPTNVQLRYLDLSFCCNLGDIAIHASMACWGATLTHLRLNSLYELTDEAVKEIAAHCPNLKLLHLVRCWQITNAPLEGLALACPKLCYISVAFLSRTHEEGIRHFIHHCEYLEWLDITGTGINQLYKQAILSVWKSDRERKGWGQVHIQDDQVFLL